MHRNPFGKGFIAIPHIVITVSRHHTVPYKENHFLGLSICTPIHVHYGRAQCSTYDLVTLLDRWLQLVQLCSNEIKVACERRQHLHIGILLAKTWPRKTYDSNAQIRSRIQAMQHVDHQP